jgi:hypothetical protein
MAVAWKTPPLGGTTCPDPGWGSGTRLVIEGPVATLGPRWVILLPDLPSRQFPTEAPQQAGAMPYAAATGALPYAVEDGSIPYYAEVQ